MSANPVFSQGTTVQTKDGRIGEIASRGYWEEEGGFVRYQVNFPNHTSGEFYGYDLKEAK